MRIHSAFLVVLAAVCLLVPPSGVARAAADLTPSEVQQLSRFDGTPGLRDIPDFARAEMRPKIDRSYAEARAFFTGRGADVARHFLTHTDVPPETAPTFLFSKPSRTPMRPSS